MNKFARYIISLFLIIGGIILLKGDTFGNFYRGNSNTIYNNNEGHAINTELGSGKIGDPFRDGAYHIIHSANGEYTVEGIVKEDNQIETHNEAMGDTIQIIRNAVNRALGMLSLVALVYIIIQGFIILTAAGDDGKQKKGIAGIKRAGLAIIGIGLSRFIVTFIFWIIRGVAGI